MYVCYKLKLFVLRKEISLEDLLESSKCVFSDNGILWRHFLKETLPKRMVIEVVVFVKQ